MHFTGRTPTDYLVMRWQPEMCASLGVEIGASKFLPFFEALTALAAIVVWGGRSRIQAFALVGDNLGALTAAVSTKGKGDVARICREIALRQAREGLVVSVGHLPSELNDWADALSRLHAPTPAEVPSVLLQLPRRTAPSMSQLFHLEPPGPAAVV